jgi:hypothetical protein
MTKKQFNKVSKIIRGDATLRYRYANGEGDYCVIGGLLSSLGVSDGDLIPMGTKEVYYLDNELAKIQEAFGLKPEQTMELQRVNDRCDNVRTRRRRLITFLKTLL